MESESKTSTLATVTANSRGSFMDRLHRVVLISTVLLVGVGTLVLAVLGAAWFLWDRENDAVVQTVRSAGRVKNLSLVPGLVVRSLVETDSGFYAVREGASLAKGEPLTLETRANTRRYLCDSQHRCLELL